MSRDTDKSFFILSPLANKHAGLYQQLLSGIVSYKELGNRIIKQIKAAHAFRQIDKVRELSRLLLNFPIKEYQLIGQYYLIWCDGRESRYDTKLLERIIDQTTTYKTEAMLSLAAFEGYQGRIEASIYFYTDALKTCPSVSDYIISIRSIAALKSVEGFHELALKDLENLLPLVRHAEPLVCYDFLNSYAVELGEAGRKQEARNVSRIVVASPFAQAYPEWQETARDLKEPARSFVALEPTLINPHNVVSMPLAEHVESERVSYNQPSKVTNLQQWKIKMAKDEKPPEELSTRQIVFKIIDFYTDENTTNEQRHRIWEAVQKIMSQPNPPDTESDDTEGA